MTKTQNSDQSGPNAFPTDLLSSTRAALAEIDILANEVQWNFNLVKRNLDHLRLAIADQPIGDGGDMSPLTWVLQYYADSKGNSDCHALVSKIMAVARNLREVEQNAPEQQPKPYLARRQDQAENAG